LYEIKPASYIKFLPQLKVVIKHYIILSVGFKHSVCDLLCDVINQQSSVMRNIYGK